MKKIFAIALVAVFILGMAVTGFAGLKEIKDIGTKAELFIAPTEDTKSYYNTTCTSLAALESATGADLKSVSDAKVQAYFSGVTLSQAQIDVIKAAALIDQVCELLDIIVPQLPATDL